MEDLLLGLYYEFTCFMNNCTWIDLEGKTEEVTFAFKLFLRFSSEIVSYRCLFTSHTSSSLVF